MASSLLTAAKPFLLSSRSPTPSGAAAAAAAAPISRRRVNVRRRNSLMVLAIAQKWEPSKVVPQADRVLIRLEELPEVDLGTEERHCFCKANDLLAVVE